MTTVISTSVAGFSVARRLLPATGCIVHGRARVYLFYRTNGGKAVAYSGIDGESLIESRTFETQSEAETWVRDDDMGVQ